MNFALSWCKLTFALACAILESMTVPERVLIPYFGFYGLHPDAIHLDRTVSPLAAGKLHSAIAVSCFLLGKTEQKNVSMFNAEVYEQLGYTKVFEKERLRLVADFVNVGIDINDDFCAWEKRGKFLHTYNHPKDYVLFDIVKRAFAGRGAKGEFSIPYLLADMISWPVYPEIAAAHSIHDRFVWRKGKDKNHDELDLPAFVAATFTELRRVNIKSGEVPQQIVSSAHILEGV